MDKLLKSIDSLKGTSVKSVVKSRLGEFKAKRSKDELFIELCFCLLTANFNAERSIRIQNDIGKGFLTLPEGALAAKLKQLGHRFPNARAKYIVAARKHKDSLVLDREWLVKNILGLGYKEASHFLRNVGFHDYAIVDFHIVDLLVKNNIIKPVKTRSLTKARYLAIEDKLRVIGNESGTNLAELDLYLWFMETGKVLK